MIKQCGYCNRVYGKDGAYYDIGLTVPIIELYMAPPQKEKVSVSHAVCPDCFESMIDSFHKDAETREGKSDIEKFEDENRPNIRIAR